MADQCDPGTMHLALAAKAGAPSGVVQRENAAKGQIFATDEEVRSGTHNDAMRKELKCFKDLQVLDTSGRPPAGVRRVPMRWVHTWKLKNGERIAKSRLV